MSQWKPVPIVPIVYLALGSNLGDRRRHLRGAVEALCASADAELIAASALYATEAVGIADGPEFLNAAISLRTSLSPEELLSLCLAIEISAGRDRGGERPAFAEASAGRPPSSRPLDLDLLIWPGETRATPALTLPHPRLHERAFVLAPLSEIAPELVVHGRTTADWAAAVGTAGVRRLPGTENWARGAPA